MPNNGNASSILRMNYKYTLTFAWTWQKFVPNLSVYFRRPDATYRRPSTKSPTRWSITEETTLRTSSPQIKDINIYWNLSSTISRQVFPLRETVSVTDDSGPDSHARKLRKGNWNLLSLWRTCRLQSQCNLGSGHKNATSLRIHDIFARLVYKITMLQELQHQISYRRSIRQHCHGVCE